jgi:hypothetical protein
MDEVMPGLSELSTGSKNELNIAELNLQLEKLYSFNSGL